jgi:hypothetical protein
MLETIYASLARLHPSFADPMFDLFIVKTFLLGLVSFFVLALPWTVIAWLDVPYFRKYRVQKPEFLMPASRALWPSLQMFVINHLAILVVFITSW